MKKETDSLDQKLSQIDFSKESNKQEIKNKVLLNALNHNDNSEGVEDKIKFNRRFKPSKIAAASLICVLGFSAIAYGAEWVRSRMITLDGNINFAVSEMSPEEIEERREESSREFELAMENNPLLREAVENNKSFVFDYITNEVIILPEDGWPVERSHYDEDGNYLGTSKFESTSILTTQFENFEEVQELMNPQFRVPTILPEGFNLEGIYGFSESGSDLPEEFTHLGYSLINSNGNEIFVRSDLISSLVNEERGFTSGVSANVEEIDINGNKALLDEDGLIFTLDGVLYMFWASGNIESQILIDLAKSLM